MLPVSENRDSLIDLGSEVKTIYLTPYALYKNFTMKHQSQLLIQLQVCLNPNLPPPRLSSYMIAESGAVTQQHCDKLPCTADSINVKCAVSYYTSFSSCDYQLLSGQHVSYVKVVAAGKTLGKNKKYYSHFSMSFIMQ